ncbi:unnamed protein product [Vicia faba]|uniref:HMA domain-containing protein n=1 Tax=Vicia faba TaxID=3906 RepID=A0AAV0Z1Q8_VICFA|nr:unnamed protein product [Vicia faba]
MAKQKNKTNDQTQKQENNETKNNNNKKEDETKPTTVILKVDMHCDGCASKIVKCIRGFEALKLNLLVEGFEKMNVDKETGKFTINGTVDAAKLRDKLVSKTKKKVDLISPVLKNDKENKDNKDNKNKPQDKKPKELPVSTTVLKMELHCHGCIEKIKKTVSKTKGVYDVKIDKEKETVTVKGTMDVKVMVEKMKKKFKRKVEVVPQKKENEKEKEKNKGENDGGKKNKGKGEGGNSKVDENDGKGKKEVMANSNGYGCGFLGFDYGYNNNGEGEMVQMHAPQMFSDENPNACCVM